MISVVIFILETIIFLGTPIFPLFINFPTPVGNVNLAEEIGVHYFKFGIQLLRDDSGAQMSAFVKECLGRAEEINCKIFQKWLEGNRRQPVTWETLVHVLDDIGLRTLAQQIKESFLRSLSSQSGTF